MSEDRLAYNNDYMDDRFIKGNVLIETNFKGYVVEKNPNWGFSLFKVQHKSDLNPNYLYLIVKDETITLDRRAKWINGQQKE